MVTKDWKDARRARPSRCTARCSARCRRSRGCRCSRGSTRRCRRPGSTTSSWCSRATRRRSRCWRPWARSSAPAGRAASSCTWTPTSRSTCPRRASSSTASRWPTWGSTWPSVGQELGTLLGGGYVNRFNYFDRSYKVIPQIGDAGPGDGRPAARPQDQDAERASWCRSRRSRAIETSTAPRTLNRFQQRNAVRVFGGVQPGRHQGGGAARCWRQAAAAAGGPGRRARLRRRVAADPPRGRRR